MAVEQSSLRLQRSLNKSQHRSIMPRKTSSKAVYRLIQDPVYHFTICLAIGGTIPAAERHFGLPSSQTDPIKDNPASLGGMVVAHDGYNAVLIWFPIRDVHYAYLAHEAIHAALFIFNDRGVSAPVWGADEHFTYYHSWLMLELSKYLRVSCEDTLL